MARRRAREDAPGPDDARREAEGYSGVYLTNPVKHFKWRPKGKRRIHDTPNWTEIRACDVWLRLELARIRPEVLVLLGATAAQAVLGRSSRVSALRGRVLDVPELDARVVVTLHPSAVLRAGERRGERRAELVADLGLVPTALAAAGVGIARTG